MFSDIGKDAEEQQALIRAVNIMTELLSIPMPALGWNIPGLVGTDRKVDGPPAPALALVTVAFGPASAPDQILDGIGQALGGTFLKYRGVIRFSEMDSRNRPGGPVVPEDALLLDLLPDIILDGKRLLAWKSLRELHIAILNKVFDLRFCENFQIH